MASVLPIYRHLLSEKPKDNPSKSTGRVTNVLVKIPVISFEANTPAELTGV